MKRQSLVFVVACVLISPTYALADVLHVPQDFATIQEAVDAAFDGDKIQVAGSYVGPGARVDGKRLELDGGGALINQPFPGGAVGILIRPGASGSTVSHFTFQDIASPITVLRADEVTISHNTILTRSSEENENALTGIRVIESLNSVVSHNVIANYAISGIFISSSENVLVQHNTSVWEGGPAGTSFPRGIFVLRGNTITITQNTISQTPESAMSICLRGVLLLAAPASVIVSFNDFRGLCDPIFNAGGGDITIERNLTDVDGNRGEGMTN